MATGKTLSAKYPRRIAAAALIVYAAVIAGFILHEYGLLNNHIRWQQPSVAVFSDVLHISPAGLVFINRNSGTVACDATGNVRWRLEPTSGYAVSVTTGENGNPFVLSRHISNTPAISFRLAAYDLDSQLQWEVTLPDAGSYEGLVAGPDIIHVIGNNHLAGYDLSGNVKYRQEEADRIAGVGRETGPHGELYYVTGRMYLVAVGTDGTERWRESLMFHAGLGSTGNQSTWYGNGPQPVAGPNGTVLIALNDMVVCFGPGGNVQWQQRLFVNPSVRSYAYTQESVDCNASGITCAQARDGAVHVYDATGNDLYSCRPRGTTGPPAISDSGVVYVIDREGLKAIDAAGRLKWMNTRISSYFNQPVISPDGTLYLQDFQQLYAFDP